MPGVMDRMELRKVSTEADDDSTVSLNDCYTEPIDSDKATIDRSATIGFFAQVSKDVIQSRPYVAC